MINNISSTVLFVKDLSQSMAFYENTLGLEHTVTDDVSAAYRLGDHDFVLLQEAAAADMISQPALAQAGGQRVLLCVKVEDVDATYQALKDRGVAFIKPPKDQDWGRRTTYFADPEGNLWELWHPLDG